MIKLKMIKVKSFLAVFFQSLFPQNHYYPKIIHTKFSFSFKYYLTFLSLCNFIFLVVATAVYLPPTRIINYVFDIKKNFTAFPSNLSLTINQGHLFTTLNAPYFLRSEQNKTLLLVIDEFASFEKIKEYQSKILFTNQEIVLNINNRLTRIPLSYIGNWQINKSQVEKIEQGLNTFLVLLPYIYGLGFILSYLLFNLGSLFLTFSLITFCAVVVWITYRLLQKKLGFHKHLHLKKIIQVGLHAFTMPLILDYVFTFSYFTRLLPVNYLVFLLIFIFTGVYESYFNHKQ